MHTWDPERYLTYADERGRPFVELLARVGAADPATVVDLGCGPGNLTALLVERWPDARVDGPRLQRGDDRQGQGDHTGRGRSASATSATGRRRATLSTCSSATPRCSGCPTTSTCSPTSSIA